MPLKEVTSHASRGRDYDGEKERNLAEVCVRDFARLPHNRREQANQRRDTCTQVANEIYGVIGNRPTRLQDPLDKCDSGA